MRNCLLIENFISSIKKLKIFQLTPIEFIIYLFSTHNTTTTKINTQKKRIK